MDALVTPNTKLLSQQQVIAESDGWHRNVLEDLEKRVGNQEFPCIFSKNAFKKNLMKFLFVENLGDAGVQYLGEGLKEYVEISRDWNGRIDTAYPLVVAFSLDAVIAQSVEEYHAYGWGILQALHQIDPEPWPEDVSPDPNSTTWSMCFNGMPLFCNMSNPAHQVRQSRNLGRHFILVINPRERFDVFAGDTPRGRKTRTNIRKRIEAYDGVPHAAQLGWYGEGALEWWQYGLIEENIERTDECPFKFRES